MFVEIGDLVWFEYNGRNFVEEGIEKLQTLFVNFRFWGDKGKGIYLK